MLPAGTRKYDRLLEREIEYYSEPARFEVRIRIDRGHEGPKAAFGLRVDYQGCTEKLCHAPGIPALVPKL